MSDYKDVYGYEMLDRLEVCSLKLFKGVNLNDLYSIRF